MYKRQQCDCVKLEGGKSVCPQIKAITDASIPVMAHIGLTPQSVNAFGGFKVQGKTLEAAQQLIEDAKAVEEAGAFAVVLECVPEKLARKVTDVYKRQCLDRNGMYQSAHALYFCSSGETFL